ncbi:MAG: isoleucine--tRNA ligase [Candidatus Goldiibacteriota bacterium]
MNEDEYKEITKIHLPKTKFPMKGNLAAKEPESVKIWETGKMYRKLVESRKESPKYILHDGPPYANGNIHMGHTLNKVLKDIVVRYNFFKGKNAPYVPGWDCHGMPIEHKVMEKLGSKAEKMSKLEVRKKCHEYAMRFVELQKQQFKRLGIMGEWDEPYLTLNKKYEDKMVDIFWEMYKKGLVYKGLKPVYWCSSCATALAEAEVEYGKHTSPAVYVKFRVKDTKGKKELEDAFFVIWTTTPWTLPANAAIALHPDYEYAVIAAGGEKYVVAKKMIPEFMEKTGLGNYEEAALMRGAELENVICLHPFVDRESQVINAGYITLEAGTGCVHIAPGHGHDDYISSLKYKLPILNPVDNKGRFSSEFAPMEGEYVFKANAGIIDILKEKNALLNMEEIEHSYPHCWRCKKPIIFRATNQWFIAMDKDDFRKQAVKEAEKVNWMNEWGKERIKKMLETRPDWCISRQRSWGVPIFVFSCTKCGESIVTEDTIEKVHELIREEGSDGWFRLSAAEILGDKAVCPGCGSKELEKENDIFDVWFDSGASSFAVLENSEELQWPADLYLEGSDQYRGWFQSSLLAAVGYRGSAPYKAVISTGWVVDGKGRAMHKSLGNVIDPMELIKKGGADLLRLWVSSEDFKSDQPISEEIMARVTDGYRRIRNTFRFMLGAVDDFKPEDSVEYGDMPAIDKYALHRLQELIDAMDGFYADFEFYKAYREYINFCSIFLSSFYFDIIKDRLYTFKRTGRERRSTQTVIYRMLVKLTKYIAPVLVFTADEVWRFMPEALKKKEFIQHELWDDEKEKTLEKETADEWKIIMKLRDLALKKIEDKRSEGLIKHPYEAVITLKYKAEKLDKILKSFKKDEIERIFIVSSVVYDAAELKDGGWDDGLEIRVAKSGGEKCSRCWRYTETTGKNSDFPDLCARCVDNLG